ncbi:hypothetical protein HOLleu_17502 [Holothuria leucospilota]|uniref:Uncharacterized protein n=1 Tax=Holothuria leucospilota TaxID=206669 RepID=A0A9Q1H945_HOLLE|nr:hypothetical protein HOLleu_17502 [Holothuria leucospilota]
MVDVTDNPIVGEDTVLRPSTDLILAMGIGHNNDEIIFPRLIVSDPYINYQFETARSNNYHEVLLADRANSECDVMYLLQRRTEFGVLGPPTGKRTTVLKHSRCELSKEDEGTDSEEACNICMAQNSSASNVSHKDEDFKKVMKDFLTNIDDTYGPPSQPATHLLREELSEHDEGRDLEEAHKINMTPTSNAPKVSQKDNDFKKVMKDFLTDIDDTYGPPSQPATHLLREELSEHDEERDLDEAHKINMTPKSNAPKVSQEDKDFKQAMKYFQADIDNTYGAPSQPATHLTKEEPSEEQDERRDVEAHKICMAPKVSSAKEFQEEKDFKEVMKDFLTDIDETYGPPSRRASHLFRETPFEEAEEEAGSIDSVEAHKIHIAKKGAATKMSQENKDSQQVLRDFLTDIDETSGNIKTPRRRLTNFLWGCQEVIFYVLDVYRYKQIL